MYHFSPCLSSYHLLWSLYWYEVILVLITFLICALLCQQLKTFVWIPLHEEVQSADTLLSGIQMEYWSWFVENHFALLCNYWFICWMIPCHELVEMKILINWFVLHDLLELVQFVFLHVLLLQSSMSLALFMIKWELHFQFIQIFYTAGYSVATDFRTTFE